jgi:hypothetical protein
MSLRAMTVEDASLCFYQSEGAYSTFLSIYDWNWPALIPQKQVLCALVV